MNSLSPRSMGLVVFAILLNFGGVKSRFCAFDFQVYYNEGTFDLKSFSNWFEWTCQDSYVVSIDNQKSTLIRIYDANIDCSQTNLQLIDSNNQVYDHCNGNNNMNYQFMSRAQWIRVRKIKNCYFCAPRITYKMSIAYVNPDATTTQKPQTIQPPQGSCGIPAISPDLSELKIVGGKEPVKNSWPWQVYITDNEYSCGASLINNQWLLSAAHCKFTVAQLNAYLGYHDLGGANPKGQIVKVARVINHPNYDTIRNLNDISLMKLDRPVQLTNEINIVCLPNGRRLSIGDRLTVTGWGNTDESGISTSLLQQVSVTLNQKDVCTAQFNEPPLISTQICAGVTGNNPKDSCQGDSGGPLVRKDSATNSFYVAGIVSQGVGCSGHGVYTNVVDYEAWIKSTIQNN